MFDAYKNRMERRGRYMGETMRNQTQHVVDVLWMNSVSVRPVCVHALDKGLPPTYHSDADFEETLWGHFEPNKKYSVGGNDADYYLIFQPHIVAAHPEIKVGSYVSIPNIHNTPEYWLIVYMDEDNGLVRTHILKCNWVLKWVANNKTYNCLSVLRSGSSDGSGTDDGSRLTYVDSISAIWLPTNSDSQTIGANTRFLISDEGRVPPLAWVVSRIRDTAPIGVTRVSLSQDVYNNRDNSELMIADYYIDVMLPEASDQAPVVEEFRITYNGTKPTVKVGGSAKLFTAQLPEDNHFDIKWSVSDGVNTYGDSYDNYTQTFGDYTMTTEDRMLKLSIARNYDLVGTILTISALSADGSNGTLTVEVVS